MTLKERKVYQNYYDGGKAQVIRINDDDTVTYQIIAHPDTPELIGCIGRVSEHIFKIHTCNFNTKYRDHKQKLKV